MNKQDYQKIVYDWNLADKFYSRNKTIHQLFEKQVSAHPNNIAVVFKKQELTYKELDEKSNQLARYIINKYDTNEGILPKDTLICLFLDRSLETIISILAVLKAGGAYVPIDPEYPQERIRYIMEDTNAKILLTQNNYVDSLKESFPTLSIYTIDGDEYFRENSESLSVISSADNLAYVIYTSGTTGKPKGVMQLHSNVCRLFSATEHLFKFNDKDVWTLFHSYVFDFSVWEIWGALLYGGKLLIPDNLLVRSTKDFVKYCYDHKVSVLNQTPLAFYSFIANLDYDYKLNLRYVIFGGDALNVAYLKNWWKYQNSKHLDTSLINMYGITETTVHVTYKEVDPSEETLSNIGKRINDQKIYILNDKLKPVAVGEEGELYIGGAGLARGYLNREELTSERFIKNPFVTEEDISQGYTRMYKTGDVGKWLENGDIDYIGRNDFQVKIRGYRIELGEIENAVLENPCVSQVCVLAKNNGGVPYLIAYIKSRNNQLTDQDIFDFLKDLIPEYMMPSVVIFLSNFPLTINGKLDRNALPEPKFTSKNFIAPESLEEKQVCQAYKEVLDSTDEVGIDDDFYKLGGNSIKATWLLSKLRDNFQITIRDIFVLKTPREIAKLPKQNIKLSIEKYDIRSSYPLSYQQERMFYASNLDKGSILYNVPFKVYIKGDVDFIKLGNALTSIIKKNTILLNSYFVDGADIMQRSNQNDFVSISKELARVSAYEELDVLFENFIKPFDLLSGEPLARFKLVRLSSMEHCLFMDFHHICFDGGSVSIFMKNLVKFYREEKLDSTQLSYVDYVVWQKETHSASELYAKNLSYWQLKLSDINLEPLELPLDYPRPHIKSYIGGNVVKELDSELVSRIKLISDKHQVSIYAIMLHTFEVLISKYSQRKSFVLGTLANGRIDPKLDDVVGMFVNTLPFVVNIDDNITRIKHIKQIYQQTIDMLDHQDLDLEDLVTKLGLESVSGNPLCDIVFNFLEHKSSYSADNLTFEIPPWTDPRTAKFDLMAMCHLLDDKLIVEFNYATSLFKESTVTQMMVHYINILDELSLSLDKRISEYRILGDKEYKQIIYDWNNTFEPYSNGETVHSLFEQQVNRTPDKQAVVFGDISLSYQLLDEESNKLARYIIKTMGYKKALPKDTLICLYLDRSLDMLISILAILKAGGAYVPIAPHFPEERSNYILNDTKTKVVITQSHYANFFKKINRDIDILAIDTIDYHAEESSKLLRQNIPDSLAYVIYTSGTTGNPKGVMVEHSSVVNRIEYMSKFSEITAQDIYFFKTNYIFDVSVSDIFTHLCFGACIYLSKSTFDISEIAENINKCNSIHLVPSQYEVIKDLIKGSKIEKLYLSGEAIIPQIIKDLSGKLKIYNYYGPTETGEITVSSPSSISNSIGKVFQNSQAYILDENLTPVPIGVAGELYISGIALARGYLNREELTSERFINNPFNSNDNFESKKLYKTGDLVKWGSDGSIDYIGRNDFQVKVRGYRIELGEIEKSLSFMPEIDQSCVIAKDNQGTISLVAYVTLNGEVSEKDIKEFLSKNLPEYMIPSFIIVLAEFPLTLNGKLDRKALPDVELINEVEFVSPETQEQELICNAYSQILNNVTKVGIKDDFYSLGGNSIKAIQLVYILQENFKVTVADIFKYKTPEKLSKNIKFSKDNLVRRLEKIKQTYLDKEQNIRSPQRHRSINISNIEGVYTQKEISTVLLTGATGYLGCNILYQLLFNSNKSIILLIRGENREVAENKIVEKFKFYFDLSLHDYKDRVKIYHSDIENMDRLGLNIEEYNYLIDNVDSIIHSAALVKHYGEYKDFYSANVQATINLLDLAKKTKLKDFHYISTFGIFYDGYVEGQQQVIFDEKSTSENLVNRSNVYLTTKYEGELECYKYRNEGVVTNIYRVGYLSVISFNGKNQENIEENGFFTRLKAMINLGAISKEVATSEVSLVDITAKTIVSIFDKKELNNRSYHVFNPINYDLSKILIEEDRLNLERLNIIDFIDMLIANFNKSTYKSLIEMFMLHQGWLQDKKQDRDYCVEVDNSYTM